MTQQESPVEFNKKAATTYDAERARLSPLKSALHLFMELVLQDVPESARVLCVGSGTGAELIYLAKAFPKWTFTALDPAAPMLEICREAAAKEGVLDRITFHEGYLDSLPDSEPFDVATAVLVSHFLQTPERTNFFAEIANRLTPNGIIISADIATDQSAPTFEQLYEVWNRMHAFMGVSPEKVEKFRAAFGTKISVIPPSELADLIQSAGFEAPVQFFQALFIHAFFARKKG